MINRLSNLLEDLRKIRNNGVYALAVEFTFLESVVHGDFTTNIEKSCNTGILADVVTFRSSRIVDSKHGVFNAVLGSEFFQFLFHRVLIIGKEDHEGTHLLPTVVSGCFVYFLDQTGQVVVDIACENRDDGVTPVTSDQARRFAGVRAGNVCGVEGTHAFAGFWPGLEFRSEQGACVHKPCNCGRV